MSKKEEYNVVILSRAPVTVYPKLNVAEEQLIITYVAAGLWPGSITIKKADWNLPKERDLIRKDIERRLSEKTESYKV